jgi:hypothetical protein
MNVLDVVLVEIGDETERLKDELTMGVPKDFAEYRYLCGVLNGYYRLETYIKDLSTKLEQFDE